MRKLLKLAIAASVVAYVAVAGAMWAIQDQLLYFPDSRRPDPVRAGVPEMQVVSLQTADGLALNAWYRPAQDGAPTVVVMHGNGDNIAAWGRLARPLLDAGMGLLLFDYRGYGGNAGMPSEAGFLMDGEAALAFLAGQGVPASRVALYGESLGSGIAMQIAARHRVGAVVLHAPYTSVAAVASYRFPLLPVDLLIRDRYDSMAVVERVEAPVLLMHGERDVVIPVDFGRKLFAAIRAPKEAVWVPDGEHHNLIDFGVSAKVVAFLRGWLQPQ
jgi:fermentation-respiration switch protein FrsA (DUF1100 family)